MLLFVFLLLVLYPLFFLPAFGWRSEIFAESATNYVNTAQTMPLSQGIWVTDYGYLPLLPRLISYLIEFLQVPSVYIPLTYDLIASVFIAACVVSFAGSWGRVLLRNDKLRLFFAFLIFMLPDYELKSFINFSYWLFIPLFLLTLKAWYEPLSFKYKHWVLYILSICVAILSKPLFFVMIPFLGLLGIKMILQKVRFQRWLWLLLVPAAALAQLAISRSTPKTGLQGTHLDSLLYGFLYVPLAVVEKFFGHIIIHNKSKILLLAIGLVFIGLFLYKYVKKTTSEQRKEFWPVLLFAGLVVYVNAYICLQSYQHYFEDISNFKLRPILSLFAMRHWFFANLASYFLVLKFFDLFPADLKKTRVVFLLLIVFASKHFALPIHPIAYSPFDHGHSAWKESLNYYKGDLKKAQAFCIPVNPTMWFYTKNCEVVGPQEAIKKFYQAEEQDWLMDPLYVLQDDSIKGSTVHWVGLLTQEKLSSQDVEIRVDGKPVPAQKLSNQIEMNYFVLNQVLVKQKIEVIIKKPAHLGYDQKQPLILFAKTQNVNPS